MSVLIDAIGTTYTLSGLTLKANEIDLPGWEKDEIDVTKLDNAAYRTYVMGTLKKVDDLTLSGIQFDAAVYKAIPEGNAQLTITLPGAAGTLTYWVQVKKVTPPKLSRDGGEVTFDVTLKVTNRNGSGVETGPA